MAESHIISGLVTKRAELTVQIDSYQAEITRIQNAISHLDGTIKLFAPEYDLRTIGGKRTNTPVTNIWRMARLSGTRWTFYGQLETP